ncbi:hypothetical protein PYH66_13990 (plasmid) [Staphylococcus delphini]|uniref:hypothetical protein n=1 Tax=Staphylococcus delphini TaxID=53344 RepID=UPI003364B482
MGDVARFIAEIEADIRDFERDIQRAIAMAKSLPDDITVEIDASINKFRAKLLTASAMAKRFEADDIDKKIDLNASPFKRGLMLADKQLGVFGKKMDTLANDIRTTGTVFANMIKGTMLSSISILVPAIASIVPALMAVLNAVGVVGGGVVGLANAFGIAGAGVVGFGAMAVSALKMVENGTLATTKEVNNYNDALDDLQSAWQKVVQGNQAQIFNTLANAVNTAQVALRGLTPFLNGVAKGMETASAKVLDWARNSQTASKFFDMMGTTGVRIFNNMLSAAGSFGSGLVAVLTNLAPLTEWVSKGFSNMGKRFNEWANSVEGSKAIQNFTAYVQRNLPLIGQIFGSTFRGIFNLMKAFAANSELIFQSLANMAGRFEEWSAKIAQSDGFQKFIDYVQQNGPLLMQTLGNIINIIINVGTAMAPLASAVLQVVEAFTQWLAKVTETHPAIGILLGVLSVLGGAFMALYPAIQFVTTVIIPLLSQFSSFTKETGILRGALNALRGVFSFLSTSMMAIIGVIAIVVMAVIELWQTNEQFRNDVTTIWNSIGTIVSAVGTVLMNIFTGIMNVLGFLAQAFAPVIAAIVHVIAVIFEWVASFIQANEWVVKVISIIGILVGIFFMVQGAISIVAGIVGLLSAAFSTLATIAGIVAAVLGAISAPVWIVIGVIVALIAIVVILYNKFEWFRNLVDPIIGKLKEFAEAIMGPLSNALSWLGEKLGLTGNKAQETGNKISASLSQGTQQASTNSIANTNAMQMGVSNNFDTMKNNALTASSGMNSDVISNLSSMQSGSVAEATGMNSAVSSSIDSMKNNANSKVAGMNSNVTSNFHKMSNSVNSSMNTSVNSVQSGMSRMNSIMNSSFFNITSNLQSSMKRLQSIIMSTMNQMRSITKSTMNSTLAVFRSRGNQIVSVVSISMRQSVSRMMASRGQFISAGIYAMQGFVVGMNSQRGSVMAVAASIANAAASRIRSALKIHSPSRVFMEIGNYTGEGLAIGIHQMTSNVVSEVESMANQMEKAYAPELKSINPQMDKDINGMSDKINGAVSSDITNGVEVARPIVNITNESDLPAIKTYVDDESAKERMQRRI